jgi:CubicO group peptidase (beta-lactamase class C family)
MIINNIARRDLLGGSMALGLTALATPSFAAPKRSAHFDWKLHKPEAVGMSAAGLAGVRAAVQKHIDKFAIAGAVTAIARHGKLVWCEAQGLSRIETNTPMQPDNMFRMMSSTKPVTAVAVLMMVEAGRLSLDDKISRFIPSFANPKVAVADGGGAGSTAPDGKPASAASAVKLVPAARELTIKDLLTHTNGLSTGGPGSQMSGFMRRAGESSADYMARLGTKPLDFQPGSRFAYSPIDAFDLLLYIVELVARVPADRFAAERIFKPLGMKDTAFSMPAAKESRAAGIYERKDNAWKPVAPLFGTEPWTYVSGAGGLVSTVHDYMQFEQMLLNRGELNGRRVLKPETVALMASNHVGDLFEKAVPAAMKLTTGQGFGLGVAVTLDPVAAETGRGKGAFGWNGAYGTDSWADPELDLTAAFFVQNPTFPVTLMAGRDFMKAVRAAIVDF